MPKKRGKLNLNLANVPSNNIPPGDYEAVIDKVEVKEAKDGGSYYLSWEFSILDEEYLGRKVWMISSLKDGALWNLKAQLVNLGFDPESEIDLDWNEETGMLTEPDFVSVNVVIDVVENTYQGQTRSQVANILESELLWDEDDDDEDDDDEIEEEEKPKAKKRKGKGKKEELV